MHLVLLYAHAIATAMMFGVIWTMQVVHYPLFLRMPAPEFPAFEREHMRRIGWIVVPAMIAELGTAAAIAAMHDRIGVDPVLAWVGLGLVVVNWLSTAIFQGPMHRRLADGKDDGVIRRLVATNWVRTAAWTGRMVIAVAMIWGSR